MALTISLRVRSLGRIMAKKQRVTLFRHTTEKVTLSIYDSSLRKLFGLPVRQGKLTGVVLDGQCIRVSFELDKHKHHHITL
jgi:hypothetical protein